MEVQNQVEHSLRGNLSRLHNVLDAASSQGIKSLGRVAERVCEAFDLRDGRGRWQRASYRKALADLEAAGAVSLPPPRRRAGAVRRPRGAPPTGGAGTRCPWQGRRAARACAGAGRDRRATPGLEHADGTRASARRRSLCRPSDALSRRLRARLAGRRGVRGLGAAADRPRRLGRMGGCAPTRPPAPGGGAVPDADSPRRCLPQPGLPRAGPGDA